MEESREAEYARLADQVAEIERLMKSGARSDAGYLLTAFLGNAQSRMETIRFEVSRVEQERKERKEQETATIAFMVERESNLSAAEKEQYGKFLEQDYFTKANFGDLELFYANNTWDKLSENGKAEMSHRVWEGVRRDEYSFDELPEEVRKKEAERLYQQFTGKVSADSNLDNIPQADRADFIREHEAGNEKAETQVLSRECFSKNVSTRSSTEVSKKDASVSIDPVTEVQESAKKDKSDNLKIEGTEALDGITFADASEATRPEIQRAGGSRSISKG